MKIINISKAQPLIGEVESVTIVIDKEVLDLESLQEDAKHYQEDATKIVDALEKALPGGTFDRVAAALLAHKASHLKIAHQEEQ